MGSDGEGAGLRLGWAVGWMLEPQAPHPLGREFAHFLLQEAQGEVQRTPVPLGPARLPGCRHRVRVRLDHNQTRGALALLREDPNLTAFYPDPSAFKESKSRISPQPMQDSPSTWLSRHLQQWVRSCHRGRASHRFLGEEQGPCHHRPGTGGLHWAPVTSPVFTRSDCCL